MIEHLRRLKHIVPVACFAFAGIAGCAAFKELVTGTKAGKTSAKSAEAGPKAMSIRSFSDSLAATAVLGSGNTLWMGTARGLLKWDTAAMTSTLITSTDGLPGNRVAALALDATGSLWVATAGGITHQVKGAWKTLPPSPVGEPVSAIVITADGAGWVGGPTGLAKLNKKGAWEHYLGNTPVTALVATGNDVWVGTAKHGIDHVIADKKEDRVEAYGPLQGAEVDVTVSSLTATAAGVVALGETKDGQQRIAYYDGFRFWTYRVANAALKISWVRKIGNDALIGIGQNVYALMKTTENIADDGKTPRLFTFAKGTPLPPLAGLAKDDAPAVVVSNEPGAKGPVATAAFAPPPEKTDAKTAKKGKGAKGKKDAKPTKAEAAAPAPAPAAPVAATPAPAAPAVAAAPAPAVAAVDPKTGVAIKPAAVGPPTPVAGAAAAPTAPGAAPAPKEVEASAPMWVVTPWTAKLPEGVSAVGPDGPTLYVGTRMLGAAKVDEKDVTSYRRFDLVDGAEHLTVACERPDDCWMTTGIAKAWHFDGNNIEWADIDPEEGSKVLAVLDPPNGTPMALSRGKADTALRVSSESGDRWVPMIFRDLNVPTGVPDLTFSVVDPNKKHLWLGLRYVDKDGDAVDYGAAEVDLNETTTTYHRQVGVMSAKDPSVGTALPNDVDAACFPNATDGWFGTRSGAARLRGKDTKLFTENDGLASEIIHDIVLGPDNRIWVATNHGVGNFDGTHWSFPVDGDRLKVKATSFARDKFGWVYVGTTNGLLLTGPRNPDLQEPFTFTRVDPKLGLLDDHIIDLAMDRFGRVWALTEKGLSIVER